MILVRAISLRTDTPSPPQLLTLTVGLLVGNSNATKVGVSYRKLPRDYLPPLCSGRTPFWNSVLNDEWVSASSGMHLQQCPQICPITPVLREERAQC